MATKLFALVAVLGLSLCAMGQPLANKVPGDAIIYVGWQGSANMGVGYDGSNLKGFMEASQLPQQLAEFLPNVMRKLGEKDRNAAQKLRILTAVAGPLWRHPSAFYFAGMDLTNPNDPKPKMALLVDAADEAAGLSQQLQGIADKAGPKAKAAGIKVTAYGNLVVVAIGLTASEESLISGGNDAAAVTALSANAAFTTAMGQVRKEPVAAVYVDGQALVKLLDEAVSKGRDRDAKQNWPALRDGVGLQGLKHVAWAAGFAGKDWASDLFVEAPEPAVGFVGGMMSAKPVSAEAYAAIPKEATMAGVFRFDPSGVFNAIREIATKIDPHNGQNIDQGLTQANQMLGLDVDKDLLARMGDEWVYYVDPTQAGSGLMGFTLINRLKDPAKFEASAIRVEQLANGLMAGAGRGQGMSLGFKELKRGELTVHYLGVPVVTPSWAVKDGNFYVALFPQVLVGAAEHVAKKGDSILRNEKFVALRERMGGKDAINISFLDLPRTAPDAYQTLLFISRMYLGAADMFGMKAPPMMPPPLTAITPYLDPAGSVSWVDEKGWHSTNLSPFPGSESLAQSGIGASMAGQNALLISILLPSLNRARETANRVKCGSNMRQIGQAMLLYSNENKNKFPPDMAEIIKTQEISAMVFLCPSAQSKDIPQGTPAEIAKWVEDNSDYVYLGKGKTNSVSPETIVLYEKPGNHNNDGMNMLFGDGHVEFMNMPAAQKMIKEQTGKALPDGEL